MKNNKLYKLFFHILAAVVLFFACASANGMFTAETTADFIGKLADAFTVPGVIMFTVGALSWASSKGTYDIFGFGMKAVGNIFAPKRDDDARSFLAYKEKKESTRKGWNKDALITGSIFLFLAIVLVVIYSAMS